jgi:crossover junction endodeoxyribonuclease RuvC
MTLHLGIDIGVQGAVAILDQSGALLEIHDMPTLQDGPAGRRAVNAPLLASIVFKSHAVHAFVEGVNARPGEGPTGAFAFGRARGVIEGVLAAAGIPATFVTPPAWKRAVGLTLASKDASRAEAIRRYPNNSDLFKRKCDDGRAEAVLIALAGIIRARSHDGRAEAALIAAAGLLRKGANP